MLKQSSVVPKWAKGYGSVSMKTLTLQELFPSVILTSACVYTCPCEREDSGDVV